LGSGSATTTDELVSPETNFDALQIEFRFTTFWLAQEAKKRNLSPNCGPSVVTVAHLRKRWVMSVVRELQVALAEGLSIDRQPVKQRLLARVSAIPGAISPAERLLLGDCSSTLRFDSRRPSTTGSTAPLAIDVAFHRRSFLNKHGPVTPVVSKTSRSGRTRSSARSSAPIRRQSANARQSSCEMTSNEGGRLLNYRW